MDLWVMEFYEAVGEAVWDNDLDDSGQRNAQTIAEEFQVSPETVRQWGREEASPDPRTKELVVQFILDKGLNIRRRRGAIQYERCHY